MVGGGGWKVWDMRHEGNTAGEQAALAGADKASLVGVSFKITRLATGFRDDPHFWDDGMV